MAKTLHVVMKQGTDMWPGHPRSPEAVFTNKADAEKYCLAANFALPASSEPTYQFWVDYNEDIQLDPETYKGRKYNG